MPTTPADPERESGLIPADESRHPDTPLAPSDEQIGANVKAARLAARLSQADLAASLSEQGFPFSQQTILKVEKGQRPLKLTESMAIADMLQVRLRTLTDFDVNVYGLTASTNSKIVRTLHYELQKTLAQYVKRSEHTKNYLDGWDVNQTTKDKFVEPWLQRLVHLSLEDVLGAMLNPELAVRHGIRSYHGEQHREDRARERVEWSGVESQLDEAGD